MIKDEVRQLAQGPNIGVITTLMPDGQPQSHPVWVDVEGDALVVNTEVHRTKYTNLQRDPRVTLTILNRENPYNYAEVRGKVSATVGGEEARRHIDELAHKYLGTDYDPAAITSERVKVKITPVRQQVYPPSS